MASWYSGAPDECSQCYWAGEIVKVSDCRDVRHTGLGFEIKIDGIYRWIPFRMPSAEFMAKLDRKGGEKLNGTH